MTGGGIRQLLLHCRRTGALDDATALEAMRIARNVLSKRQDIPEAVRQDALSKCLENLTIKWESINPDKNPGAYIGTMARNSLVDIQRKFQKDLEKAEAITEDPSQPQTTQPTRTTVRSLRHAMGGADFRKLTQQQRLKIRIEALRLRKCGLSHRAIAREIGVAKSQVGKWLARGTKPEKRGGDRRSEKFRKKTP